MPCGSLQTPPGRSMRTKTYAIRLQPRAACCNEEHSEQALACQGTRYAVTPHALICLAIQLISTTIFAHLDNGNSKASACADALRMDEKSRNPSDQAADISQSPSCYKPSRLAPTAKCACRDDDENDCATEASAQMLVARSRDLYGVSHTVMPHGCGMQHGAIEHVHGSHTCIRWF